MRYTSKKHWAQVCREMREIYTAPTVEAAEARFGEFVDTWRDRYPAMIDTWQRAWAEFVPFLDFPVELRTIVYTTNAVESLNARFRRAVCHRGHFPNEQAALKVLYLVATERRKNRANPTGQINGWKKILDTLTIHYGERIAPAQLTMHVTPVTEEIGQSRLTVNRRGGRYGVVPTEAVELGLESGDGGDSALLGQPALEGLAVVGACSRRRGRPARARWRRSRGGTRR
jgi:hypothetical protein